MKKLIAASLMFLSTSVFAAPNQVWQSWGQYQDAGTANEGVVTVSSYTYTYRSAMAKGVERWYQNTGSVNINWCTQLTSTTTANQRYLAPGQTLMLDKYFGDLYFVTPAGQATSTLSYEMFAAN